MASLRRASRHLLYRLGDGRYLQGIMVPATAITQRYVSTSSSSSQKGGMVLDDSPDMAASNTAASTMSSPQSAPLLTSPSPSPLSIVPFPSLLRSYLITSLTAHPLLLSPSMALLKKLAYSHSAILNPDKNPLLHFLLKRTFYAQFCAGETPAEVQSTVKDLKSMGVKGVMLGYAKEVILCDGDGQGAAIFDEAQVAADVKAWKEGTLKTVELGEVGDFVALKFTGAGAKAIDLLLNNQPPDPVLETAIVEICELAKQRTVKLFFDAEQSTVQTGIDSWTVEFQKRYNKAIPGQALVYGTYQAYMRKTPMILAKHLATAEKDGFTLGVKLVRGAYLSCDTRSLFWSKKEETDAAYDSITESLIRREYGEILQPVEGKQDSKFPQVNLVIASHNLTSVEKGMAVRNVQAMRGEEKIDLVYGQLQGMADDVTCELINAGREAEKVAKEAGGGKVLEIPRAYKYLVWGTVSECLQYLIRRAEENREAITRAGESVVAMRKELKRRVFGT
ncbi:MAG: proline dehydrogenase [Icmadophila ericetorum]|nr:proline dehydrogenase [Icmadophila ericetorum]